MKYVYLTIDEAPSADFKNKIKYLKSENIPAVIFCIGQQIEEYKADVVEAIKNGFVIGNHSVTHPKFSELSVAQMEDEIRGMDSIIDNLHAQAKTARTKKLFRFPYGDLREGKQADEAQRLLKKYGYEMPPFQDVTYPFYQGHTQKRLVDVFWTFNVMEYDFKSLNDIQKRLEAREWRLGTHRPENGGYIASDSAEVMIIHDEEPTVRFFQPIIKELQKQNVTFRSV